MQDEIVKDEDGIETNLTQIKAEKQSLLAIYDELNNLDKEKMDIEIKNIQEKIQERLKVLDELEIREAKRFSDKREEMILEKERISKDHFLNTEEQIEKEGKPFKLPYTELFFLGGIAVIIILLIVILCNVL